MEFIINKAPCKLEDIMSGVELKNSKEGTVLNRVRELRYIGAVNKVGSDYYTRSSIKNIVDFKNYVYEHLKDNVVVRTLDKLGTDIITQADIINSLRQNFKGYGFASKTWATYANYLIAWLHYAGIDFGNRLQRFSPRIGGLEEFTPQWRPERDMALFASFKGKGSPILRDRKMDKGLYDLKTLGLLNYEGGYIHLTKRGVTILKSDDIYLRKQIAECAVGIPKISAAYNALKNSRKANTPKFENLIAPTLQKISSASYRTLTTNVLKSWARFIDSESRD